MRKKIIATLVGGGLLAATFAATIDWSDAEAVTGSPPPPTVPVAQVEIRQVEPTADFSGSFSPVESVEGTVKANWQAGQGGGSWPG